MRACEIIIPLSRSYAQCASYHRPRLLITASYFNLHRRITHTQVSQRAAAAAAQHDALEEALRGLHADESTAMHRILSAQTHAEEHFSGRVIEPLWARPPADAISKLKLSGRGRPVSPAAAAAAPAAAQSMLKFSGGGASRRVGPTATRGGGGGAAATGGAPSTASHLRGSKQRVMAPQQLPQQQEPYDGRKLKLSEPPSGSASTIDTVHTQAPLSSIHSVVQGEEEGVTSTSEREGDGGRFEEGNAHQQRQQQQQQQHFRPSSSSGSRDWRWDNEGAPAPAAARSGGTSATHVFTSGAARADPTGLQRGMARLYSSATAQFVVREAQMLRSFGDTRVARS